jgi:hypothetical protein
VHAHRLRHLGFVTVSGLPGTALRGEPDGDDALPGKVGGRAASSIATSSADRPCRQHDAGAATAADARLAATGETGASISTARAPSDDVMPRI